MTLDELRDAVRLRLAVPDTDALFTDAVVTALINQALHHVESQSDWPWLEKVDEALAAGATVALPADHLRTIGITRSGYPALERRPAEWVRSVPADVGTPFFYAIEGSNLLLRGTGAATLTHIYIRTETELSDDADEPLIPAVHQVALVEYAAALGFRRSGQLAESKEAEEGFERHLKTMLARHGRKSPSEGGGVMPPEAK